MQRSSLARFDFPAPAKNLYRLLQRAPIQQCVRITRNKERVELLSEDSETLIKQYEASSRQKNATNPVFVLSEKIFRFLFRAAALIGLSSRRNRNSHLFAAILWSSLLIAVDLRVFPIGSATLRGASYHCFTVHAICCCRSLLRSARRLASVATLSSQYSGVIAK